MKGIKCLVATGLVLALGVGMCWAQAQPGAGGGRRGAGGGGRNMQPQRTPAETVTMMVQRVVGPLDSLNLTPEQKQSVEALKTALNEKTKPLVDKLTEKTAALKDRQTNDPDDAEGIKEMQQDIDQSNRDVYQAVTDFGQKVQAQLTDEQKTKYTEAQAQQRAGGPGQGGAAALQQMLRDLMQKVMPFDLRAVRDLQLTDAQRTQATDLIKQYGDAIEKIKTDYETKFEGILTDDQKKQYEDLKANPPAGPGMGGMGGGGAGAGGGGGRGGRIGRPGGNQPNGGNGGADAPAAPAAPAPAPAPAN